MAGPCKQFKEEKASEEQLRYELKLRENELNLGWNAKQNWKRKFQ